MRLLSLTLITFCLFGATALAQDGPSLDPYAPPDPSQELPLEGDELTALFMDRTHRGYYQARDWEDQDPAFTEVMNADGTTVHDRDGIVSNGTWRTRDNVVCFEYQDLSGGCFTIYQRGNCYYAMSAFTSTLVAVTVLDGETPSCEPALA